MNHLQLDQVITKLSNTTPQHFLIIIGRTAATATATRCCPPAAAAIHHMAPESLEPDGACGMRWSANNYLICLYVLVSVSGQLASELLPHLC